MNRYDANVLLIEDDLIDAQLIDKLLLRSSANVQLTHVTCFEAAKEALANGEFDVVLTDIGLPDCQRLEPVRFVRQRYRSTAIVVLSGDSDESCYVESIKSGADEFICKLTLDPTTLSRSIRQSRQRAKDQATLRRLISQVEQQNQELENKSLELEAKNQRLNSLCDSSRVFVNHVSHEFRTPLCVIKQYASLISDAVVGPLNDEQARMLNVIEDRVDGLNNLVDDMLDVSRHDAGLLSAKRDDVQVASIVANEIDGLRQRASIRRTKIEVDIPEQLPSVFCDAEKTGRTLVNLVTNAIKYSHKDSCVRIAAILDPHHDSIRVEVSDQGAGIPPERLSTLVDHFQQESNSLQCETKGFGLGLGIAKELAELNLGEFMVQSVVGEGSTFSFTLPVNRVETIVQKFVDYVRRRPNRASNDLTVLKIQTQGDPTERQINAIQAILSFVMRANDLLLPGDQQSCVAVLNTGEQGTQQFIDRLHNELEESNRNCPGINLPTITPVKIERLSLQDDVTALVDCIQRQNAPPQPNPIQPTASPPTASPPTASPPARHRVANQQNENACA